MKDHNIDYTTTIDIASYKGLTLAGGYALEDKAVATLTYNVLKLSDFGVSFPVAKWVVFEPGVFVGLGRVDKDSVLWNYGFTAKILDVKF